MKKFAGGRAIGAVALAVASVMAVGAVSEAKGGSDAPRIDGATAVCTSGGGGSVVLNKSGRRVTLAVSASGVAPSAGWRVVVGDTVSGVVAQVATGAVGSQWTFVLNYDASKGSHTIVVEMTSIDGANRCVAPLSFKV